MALCGFRADNYPFGFLEGEGLEQVLSLLEAIERGLSPDLAPDEEDPLLQGLLGAGFVGFRKGGCSLSPDGERLLETCRALIRARLPAPR